MFLTCGISDFLLCWQLENVLLSQGVHWAGPRQPPHLQVTEPGDKVWSGNNTHHSHGWVHLGVELLGAT